MDKIVCLGKNYLEHAQELGDAIPEKPVLFLKPPSVLKTVRNRENLKATLPAPGLGLVHHETEIVLKLCRGGFRLSVEEATRSIEGVSVGLDMTLRDLQSQLKKNGHPWTTGKVFPDAAIVGDFVNVKEFPEYLTTPFTLRVNDEPRQKGLGSEMVLDPISAVVYASQFFPLVAGDLIFTGTPKGVNSILTGQTAQLNFGDIAYSVTWG
jgi:2-keto-4-pentenoate hydratase/2-oxohepta-3-ene-1,7-dioic acid hydratase in catechol pathway